MARKGAKSGAKVKATELRALVLAAGEGTRMKSARPKVLHEVCGRPMLVHVLRALRGAGVKDTSVVVGHKRRLVQEAFADWDVRWIVQAQQRGTGHAVAQAKKALAAFKGDLLVVMGDEALLPVAVLRQLRNAHRKSGALCTVLTAVADDPFGYGRIVRDDKGAPARIVEQRDATGQERAIREINTGNYVFSCPAVFEALARLRADNDQKEYLLTDVVADFARTDGGVATVVAEDFDDVMGINSRVDLARAETIMNRRVLERLMRDGVTVTSPETTFIHETVKIGRDTVVLPFTVITGDVRIGANCRIGPFAHIRGASRLGDDAAVGNFVELKSTRLGRASAARHLTYLGDTRVGERANIGAGAITANFDGATKHVTRIGDGARIGAGTVLVAPVRVGSRARTGAGAVITKRHHVADGATVVGAPARPLSSAGGKGKGRHE